MSSPQSTGVIKRVEANGVGPNSAEVLIRLAVGRDNESFFLLFPAPNERIQFFDNLSVAFTAMWDQSTVQIDSYLHQGDQVVKAIRTIPPNE